MDATSDKALQRFAELMIEKIQQVEDNWQKPWLNIKGGGIPQNIDGRAYNGVNSFMLFLLSEKAQYSLPVYMTFMQAKDSGLNILKGENHFRLSTGTFLSKTRTEREFLLTFIRIWIKTNRRSTKLSRS